MINLGLGDVLFDPNTMQIYTPNTNKMVKMGEVKEVNNGEYTNNKNINVEGGEQFEE